MSHDRLASQEPLGESDREYGSVGVAMGAPEHQPLSECPVQNPNEIDDATKRLVWYAACTVLRGLDSCAVLVGWCSGGSS